jgi:hypothetical protein
MNNDKQYKKHEDPTAHAEKEINEYFYENGEDSGHPTDYMNNGTPAINIAKKDDEE